MRQVIQKPLDIENIKQLLEENETLMFTLEESSFDSEYVSTIQQELPNYFVNTNKFEEQLFIFPSISTDLVLDHLKEFYYCIELFDTTAHSLMNLMAETFHIDLNDSRELHDLKRNRSERQRGKINEEWQYHFHGRGCSFENKKTRQFLDVQINNGLEFGELNTYYLMKFIQTTESLKEINLLLSDGTDNINIDKVVQVLHMKGYLVSVPSSMDRGLMINRNKRP